MAKINIPPSLTRFTDNQNQLELSTETTETLIHTLCQTYPKLQSLLLNETGELTPYVNIYINGKNLNQCMVNSTLHPEDTIEIVTALAGG